MNAWIIYNIADFNRNKEFYQEFVRHGKEMNIDFVLLLVEEIDFGVNQNGLYLIYNEKEINKPDFAIVRTIYPLLNRQLEKMGILTFNNSFISSICNDKSKTLQLVSRFTDLYVESIFVKREYVYNKINNLNNKDKKFVVKTVDGHGGSQVFLCRPNEYSVEDLINKTDNKDIIIQPFINGPCKDLRVYVLGNKILSAVVRTSTNGFKSNYSLGGSIEKYSLSIDETKQVNDVINGIYFNDSSHSNAKGLSLAGIDFIINDEGKLLLNEIEDVVGCRMLYKCTDIDVVKEYLLYIINAI